MSGTVSETTIRRDNYSFVLHLRGEDAFIEEWEGRLFNILERYRSNDDELSMQLIDWGTRAITIINSSHGCVKEVVKVVQELSKIISSGIDHSPITEPVIANGRVWDRWMLEHVRKIFKGDNPYDHEPLEKGRVHEFAAEILLSVEECFEKETVAEEREELWLKMVDFSSYSDKQIKGTYRRSIQLQLDYEKADKEVQVYRAGIERSKLDKAAIEARAAKEIEMVRDSYTELEAWLVDRIKTIRSIYIRQIQELEAALLLAKQEIKALSSELTKTGERVTALETEVGRLQHTINDLRGRVHSLENDSGGGCSIM